MSVRSLIYVLWIGTIPLEVALVALLWKRKRARRFPFFTAYAVFTLLETVLLYALRKNGTAYSYVYWIGESISIVLGLAVVYEIFRQILAMHRALSKVAILIFRTSAILLLGLGVTVVAVQSATVNRGIGDAIFITEEAARVIEVGLLMILFIFSSAFGLHWRQAVFGIATGLGIFVAVELISITMRTQFGQEFSNILSIARILAFDTSLLIWIGYVLAPERVTNVELPKAAQLEQWNEAMAELIHQ